MGLDTNGCRFLLQCRKQGVDFSTTSMIGRQGLHLSKQDLADMLGSFGHRVGEKEMDAIATANKGFADTLLRFLGAREVHSFDNSGYEGATHVHDMNREIPEDFKNRYSVVLDGGTLEHVFNFPVALKNCMEMVCVGGHYLSITPTNNFCGHGFYQFSPELFFSVFTAANGFEIVSVMAFEDRPNAPFHAVMSPMQIQRRVVITGSHPTYLAVMAKKTAISPIFQTTPQQSDYVAKWQAE